MKRWTSFFVESCQTVSDTVTSSIPALSGNLTLPNIRNHQPQYPISESEVGASNHIGLRDLCAPDLSDPVASNLRFSKILSLEAFYMRYDMKECGNRIQQLRVQHNYSQQQLAKELNIDRSHLSHIESGERGSSLDLLIQFSEFFHVSLDYIILGKNPGNLLTPEKRQQMRCAVSNLIKHLKEFQSVL